MKPGGEDKVHGDPTAKSVLDKEHKLAREQGPGRSDLKATADKAREVGSLLDFHSVPQPDFCIKIAFECLMHSLQCLAGNVWKSS